MKILFCQQLNFILKVQLVLEVNIKYMDQLEEQILQIIFMHQYLIYYL